MPAAELTAWRAYWQISPFGDYRDDVHAGVVASTIANVHRGKGRKPFSTEDFMPFRQQHRVTVEEIECRINKFMKRYH